MPNDISRRDFLRGMLGATVIVGFDTKLRSWVTAADTLRSDKTLAGDFPEFDGQLVTEGTPLDEAADDYGHIIHRRPTAVLQPGSVRDISKLVRFARRHDINVSARGQGHSTYGQAQVDAGVVVDMSFLSEIHEVTETTAVVDGGVQWIDLLQESLSEGVAPPTLTDYIELSVGGTLTFGGIGSQSFRAGAQVDNVLELQVVTGRGNLVTCSPTHRRGLFNAVRAGLGQFGIIVRAKLRMVDALPNTRFFNALYSDLGQFIADQQTLIHDGRFDTVQGFAMPSGSDGWHYMLETTKNFEPGNEPDDEALFADLAHMPGTRTAVDQTYFEYLNRLGPTSEFLKNIGVWYFPHPWINLFLPSTNTVSFISDVMANLTTADVGEGPVAIYPYNRSSFQTPFLRVPDTPVFFLFALLRNAVPPTPERAQQLVDANRRLFEQAQRVGARRYPVGSVPMEKRDWRLHFRPRWGQFVAAKRAFDPDNILASGQGLFAD